MMQNQKSMSGPWDMIAKINFTRLQEALVTAMTKTGNMQSKDISMYVNDRYIEIFYLNYFFGFFFLVVNYIYIKQNLYNFLLLLILSPLQT